MGSVGIEKVAIRSHITTIEQLIKNAVVVTIYVEFRLSKKESTLGVGERHGICTKK